jgi:hypothetical protein
LAKAVAFTLPLVCIVYVKCTYIPNVTMDDLAKLNK